MGWRSDFYRLLLGLIVNHSTCHKELLHIPSAWWFIGIQVFYEQEREKKKTRFNASLFFNILRKALLEQQKTLFLLVIYTYVITLYLEKTLRFNTISGATIFLPCDYLQHKSMYLAVIHTTLLLLIVCIIRHPN